MLFEAGFGNPALPIGDGPDSIFLPSPDLARGNTVVRKISLALVLMAVAVAASASERREGTEGRDGRSDKCVHILGSTYCPPSDHPSPVKAPEIDPASALAGFTMLAGGLAVLGGRRRVNSKE